MSTSPPTLLLLDLSTLMGNSTREWQEYSRIGTCYLPQAVYDEIEFLTGRSPEPNVEKTAREFTRFFPNSGWQLTNAHAVHPAITPPGGQNLSKQARLVVSVAQCMYGFAQEHSDSLVVFVSNSQPILQRVTSLGSPNLCGITAAALLQWVRTKQQPPAVTQQLQVFGETGTPQRNSRPNAQQTQQTQKPAPANPAAITGPASAARQPTSQRSSASGSLTKLASGLLSLIVIAGLGLTAWRFIQPESFNKFWQQMGLPALSGQ